MDLRNTTANIGVGLLAGLVATRVTDHAQRVLYDLTPAAERAREPCAPPSSLVAAKKAAAAVGAHPDARRLRVLKHVIHYGLGAAWGTLYALLRRRSHMTPIGAGTVTGATLSLVIDEAICPAVGISQPGNRYPTSSHLRGFATHLVYGLALAASAEALYRLMKQSPGK